MVMSGAAAMHLSLQALLAKDTQSLEECAGFVKTRKRAVEVIASRVAWEAASPSKRCITRWVSPVGDIGGQSMEYQVKRR